jgi:predicted nucleic acid-binding Zn ribbon protein
MNKRQKQKEDSAKLVLFSIFALFLTFVIYIIYETLILLF